VEGAQWIAEAIKQNDTFEEIRFSGNDIGVEGAKWIAEGIKQNTALQLIDLSNKSRVNPPFPKMEKY
jgi:Ran GTPase-activating protein (RanGAP) involved in mRNA processing and transport